MMMLSSICALRVNDSHNKRQTDRVEEMLAKDIDWQVRRLKGGVRPLGSRFQFFFFFDFLSFYHVFDIVFFFHLRFFF